MKISELEYAELKDEVERLRAEITPGTVSVADLLRRCLQAEARLARVVEALKRYGRHDGQLDGMAPCGHLSDEYRDAGGSCTCGLHAALAAAQPEEKQ